MPGRPMSEAEHQQAVELYLAGKSATEVGRVMRPPRNRATIGRALSEAGIPSRGTRKLLTPEEEDAIIQTYLADGGTVKTTAKACGHSEQVTRRVLRERGITADHKKHGWTRTLMTEEEDRRIRELYRHFWSMDRIAEEMHWSRNAIVNSLNRTKTPRRRRGWNNAQTHGLPHEEIKRTVYMYEVEGKSVRGIAVELGMSFSAVMGRLRRHGVKMRPKGATRAMFVPPPKIEEDAAA